jgi:hypothetical protein
LELRAGDEVTVGWRFKTFGERAGVPGSSSMAGGGGGYKHEKVTSYRAI